MTEVRAVIESQFEELQAVVERAKREVTEILEGEEKQALKQAEGIRVHLEQRCTELKKTQAQVEKLSKNKNDVDFLQVSLQIRGRRRVCMQVNTMHMEFLFFFWHRISLQDILVSIIHKQINVV